MKIINVTLDTARPPTNAGLKGLSEGVAGMQKNIEALQAELSRCHELMDAVVEDYNTFVYGDGCTPSGRVEILQKSIDALAAHREKGDE